MINLDLTRKGGLDAKNNVKQILMAKLKRKEMF